MHANSSSYIKLFFQRSIRLNVLLSFTRIHARY
jgi:hypothetical protein